MAHFYGTVTGRADTSASRLGTVVSGIAATVETWKSVIRTVQFHNTDEDRDSALIEIRQKAGGHIVSFDVEADLLAKYRYHEHVGRDVLWMLEDIQQKFDTLNRELRQYHKHDLAEGAVLAEAGMTKEEEA